MISGDGAQDNDFDMSAGPSNPDESTDQVPQGKLNFYDCFSVPPAGHYLLTH